MKLGFEPWSYCFWVLHAFIWHAHGTFDLKPNNLSKLFFRLGLSQTCVYKACFWMKIPRKSEEIQGYESPSLSISSLFTQRLKFYRQNSEFLNDPDNGNSGQHFQHFLLYRGETRNEEKGSSLCRVAKIGQKLSCHIFITSIVFF